MNKRNSTVLRRISPVALPVAAAVLALLASTGCQQNAAQPEYVGNAPIGADIFTGVDVDARSVNRVVTAQTSNAARTDATLRPYHFSAGELNSLGMQKLDLMTTAERGDAPLKVYLDIPQDADQGTRREAVLVYLKDRGLKDDQMAVVAGPNLNPDSLHPTAQPLKVLHLLDAGAPVAVNSDAGVPPPPAAPH